MTEDVPLARNTDPATSHAAARRVRLRGDGWPHRIVECLERYGPSTDNEICRFMHVPYIEWPTVKSARSRLVYSHKLVVPTGTVREGQMEWRLKGQR